MEPIKKDQNTQQTDVGKTTSGEQGRQPGDAQQTASGNSDDISQVDRQEGEMNNGELGGNFDASNAEGA